MGSLELLLPALRWRYLTARNRAVVLLARLGPIAVPPLLQTLESSRTATERAGEGNSRSSEIRRAGGGRGAAGVASVTDPDEPKSDVGRTCSRFCGRQGVGGESLKRAAGLGRGAGSWSSGYDIALTWRRSPVRIRSSPLPFRVETRK